jgi:signal transduction histidine kinase
MVKGPTRAAVLDAILGLGVAVATVGQLAVLGRASVDGVVVGVVLGVAVAGRRVALPAVGLLLVAMAVQAVLGDTGVVRGLTAPVIGTILVFYALGAYVPERVSARTLVLALVVVGATRLMAGGGGPSTAASVDGLGLFTPYLLGRFVRGHNAHARGEEARAAAAGRQRERAAPRAVAGERARIARELHDVIAHNVSVMVIQAGGARLVLDADVDRAEASVRAIEQAGNDALAEMRRLLGLLGEGEPHALAPQPGLDNLPALIAGARTAGLDTTLRTDGDVLPVSPALDLCAYRVVQEALTNAIRYAAPARADVSVRWRTSRLELEVLDSGGGGRGGRAPGGGHGLIGMRERVTMHGGTLEHGRTATGGFEVRALIPVGG